MITYNHEDFVEEAVLSIFKQKTSFPFELVISDDASTDKTNEKILEVTKDLPEHITLKYFHQNPNLGMYPNFEFVLNQSEGKYIAICEGDDYWIDDEKLQKQVDFLEQNSDYNLITGHVRQYSESDKNFVEPQNLKSFTFTYKDMIVKNHCATCTTMYRNFVPQDGHFRLIPEMGGDGQLWIRALGKHGKGKKMAVVFAVYRRHENSATGIRNKKLHDFNFFKTKALEKIRKAEFWNRYFDNEATQYVTKLKINIYKTLAKVSYDNYRYGYLFLYYSFYLKYKLLLKLGV
jgi:glycosyltransferase involved in cell wall biosynthesis